MLCLVPFPSPINSKNQANTMESEDLLGDIAHKIERERDCSFQTGGSTES